MRQDTNKRAVVLVLCVSVLASGVSVDTGKDDHDRHVVWTGTPRASYHVRKPPL